jgi:hypothetical protein
MALRKGSTYVVLVTPRGLLMLQIVLAGFTSAAVTFAMIVSIGYAFVH